jgi:hypothetical protein
LVSLEDDVEDEEEEEEEENPFLSLVSSIDMRMKRSNQRESHSGGNSVKGRKSPQTRKSEGNMKTGIYKPNCTKRCTYKGGLDRLYS